MNAGVVPPRPLAGVIPILVTPFAADGSVDHTALEAEVVFLADHGVRWVGIGLGSEVQRLDRDEVETLVRCARAADDRVGVVGNTDATSIRGARHAIERLRAHGAHAVLLRPPALPGLAPDQVADALHYVGADAPLPIIVQDAAELTGTSLPAETIAQVLRRTPHIHAVKLESRDAAVKMAAVRALLGDGGGAILGGSGGAAFALELARGADGTMPGPAFPELFLALEAAHRAGDAARARRVQQRLLPYITIGNRSMDTFVYTQKYALLRRGVLPSARLRAPHALPDDPLLAGELDALLDDLERDEPGAAGPAGTPEADGPR